MRADCKDLLFGECLGFYMKCHLGNLGSLMQARFLICEMWL